MPLKRGREISQRNKVAVFACLVCLMGAVALFSIDRPFKSITRVHNKLAVVLSGGYGVNKTGGGDPVITGKAPIGGLGLQYYFVRNVGIELGGMYFRRNTEEIAGTISEGTLQSLPLQVNLLVRFFLVRNLSVCLIGGYHYMLNDFTIAGKVLDQWEMVGFTIEEKVDHKGGFQAGLSIDFYLGRSLALGFEGRYFMTEGSGTFSHTDQVTSLSVSGSLDKFRLDFMTFSLNLKFFLK